MVKVKERGRTKAPETSNLASDTRAAEPVPPAEQETVEQEIDVAFSLAFLKGSGLTMAKLAWPLRDPKARFDFLYLAARKLCSEGQALMWEAFGAATSIADATSRDESIQTVTAHLHPIMVEDGLRAAADPKARGSEGHACFRKTQSEIVTVLLGEAPATNSPIENCDKTSHKKLMLNRPNIGSAALEQRQSEFVRLAKEIGLATARKLLVEAASLDDGVLKAGMAACAREVAPKPKAPKPEPQPIMGFADMTPEDRKTALEAAPLGKRHATLKAYYAIKADNENTWAQAKGDATPKEFKEWVDDNLSDRKALGVVLSDLKHIDKPAYDKVRYWSGKDSGIPKGVIESFALPSKITPYDAERDADAPKSWTEVVTRAERGEGTFKNLQRSFHRARHHASLT
jgi:hypothetical protein